MRKLLAIAFTLSLPSFAAEAATLELIPGSHPQSARAYTFFGQPIGVIVRDDNGIPVEGVQVVWLPDRLDDPKAAYVLPFAEGYPVTDDL